MRHICNPLNPNGREMDMVVVERDASGKPTVWCDPCLVDIVRALNAAGLRTTSSCCGHGYRPGFVSVSIGDDDVWVTIGTRDEWEQIQALFQTDANGRLPVQLPDGSLSYAHDARGGQEGNV